MIFTWSYQRRCPILATKSITKEHMLIRGVLGASVWRSFVDRTFSSPTKGDGPTRSIAFSQRSMGSPVVVGPLVVAVSVADGTFNRSVNDLVVQFLRHQLGAIGLALALQLSDKGPQVVA